MQADRAKKHTEANRSARSTAAAVHEGYADTEVTTVMRREMKGRYSLFASPITCVGLLAMVNMMLWTVCALSQEQPSVTIQENARPSSQSVTVSTTGSTIRASQRRNSVGPPLKPELPAIDAYALSSESSGKRQSGEAASDVPNYITYRFFFHDVLLFDQVAARVKALGKDGDQWRTHIQRSIGLTDEETDEIRHIASEYMHMFADHDTQVRVLVASRTQHSLSTAADPEMREKLTELRNELKANAEQKIEELRQRLSEDAFQKLDAYVQKTSKPTVVAPTTLHTTKVPAQAVAQHLGGEQ